MKEYIPGPGNYDPNFGNKTNAWKFGSSTRESRDKAHEFIPGPGGYNAANPDLTQKSGAKYGFGTGSREGSLEKS